MAWQLACGIGAAAGEVRQRIEQLGIDCEFDADGYHFAVHQPRYLQDSDARVATLNAAGAQARYLEGKALQQRLGSRFYQRACPWPPSAGN